MRNHAPRQAHCNKPHSYTSGASCHSTVLRLSRSSTCSARGNYTVALSSSADKEPLAREMGAQAFINTRDAAALAAAENSLDLVIVTFK